MTGRTCTDEVRVKVPSFQKVTVFYNNIKYSSDILFIYFLISLKLLIRAVIYDKKETNVTIELSVSLLH